LRVLVPVLSLVDLLQLRAFRNDDKMLIVLY